MLLALAALGMPAGADEAKPCESGAKLKVLFLGDSITHSGHYVSMIEATGQSVGGKYANYEFINLGLSSEGVSGLSEPEHPYPRPNVLERLDRALAKVKPDVVFACYGMNDGIYYPFSEERFAAYQAGMNTLIEKVTATNAPLFLITPPPFDPEPLRASGKLKAAGADKYSWMEIYENYDTEVLARYSEWVLAQADRVAGVIDARTPVLAYVAEKRKTDPAFTLSNDGVHLNEEGHRVLAKAILGHLFDQGPAALDAVDPEALKKVHAKQMIMHAAWVSHVGHLRPGVKAGLPLDTARAVVALLESETPRYLFNGKDLTGWDGDPKIWSVEDGVIVGRNTEPVPSSTYLFTKDAYRDFRLLLEVKQTMSPEHSTMHSAVAALGERFEDEGGNAFGFKGPLLMFCHDWGIWDAYRRNRIEPAPEKGRPKVASEKKGDWNQIEILVMGNRLRFVANGELVFDFTDAPEMLQKSPFGLQIHKNAKPQEFRFRGLVLTESPEDKLVTLSTE